MNPSSISSVQIAETVLYEKFSSEPFHNLYRLFANLNMATGRGGTCSDKTESYLDSVNSLGINGFLHSAMIGGVECHRIARLEIDGKSYFADVGNGWPSIRLYPSDEELDYMCYGMRFRSEIRGNVIRVFHTKFDKEKLQMEFDFRPQNQEKVKMEILRRFEPGRIYPFDQGLRFSMIVGDRFLFVRDRSLEIFSEQGFERIQNINLNNLSDIVSKYFQYDLQLILGY